MGSRIEAVKYWWFRRKIKVRNLNIVEAYELYELVGDYVPAVVPDDSLEFLSIIVDKMSKENPIGLSKILEMLTGETPQKLVLLKEFDKVGFLIRGLIRNRILALVSFFNGMSDGKRES